jgi:hypothetical protein
MASSLLILSAAMLAQAAPGAYAPPYSLLIVVPLSAGSGGGSTMRKLGKIAYFTEGAPEIGGFGQPIP